MTLLQKIQNLTWFSNIIKLRDILLSLNTSIQEGAAAPDLKTINGEDLIGDGNIETLQDLQSVLDKGSYAFYDDENAFVSLIGGNGSGGYLTELSNYSGNVTNDGSTLQISSTGDGLLKGQKNNLGGGYSIQNGLSVFEQNTFSPDFYTRVTFSIPTVNTNIVFPAPAIAGTYTIALNSPISGTFANPTSITVTNGIITAIS